MAACSAATLPLEYLAAAKAEYFAARKDQRPQKAAVRKRKDVSFQSPRRSNGALEMQIAHGGRIDNGLWHRFKPMRQPGILNADQSPKAFGAGPTANVAVLQTGA